MESDRYIQDLDHDVVVLQLGDAVVVYNLETREVEASFALPDVIGVNEPPGLWISPEATRS